MTRPVTARSSGSSRAWWIVAIPLLAVAGAGTLATASPLTAGLFLSSQVEILLAMAIFTALLRDASLPSERRADRRTRLIGWTLVLLLAPAYLLWQAYSIAGGPQAPIGLTGAERALLAVPALAVGVAVGLMRDHVRLAN